MKTTAVVVPLLLAATVCFCGAADTNLVANGSFEQSTVRSGVPDDWSVAGNPAITQRVTLDTTPGGEHCAKLECTQFAGDGPDFHAMLCQVGKVTVRQGQWYRLSFRARGEGIKTGSVEVALTNMRPWKNAGLADAFTPQKQWQNFEMMFRAGADLPAANSRLQFWFKGTGILWLDDVVLVKSANTQQWFPQIPLEGVKNLVPNSSFECGVANWGSYTYGLKGWAGNLYRLEGQWDDQQASHGRHSLRISLTPKTEPVFYFDYYDAVRQPVRRAFAANQGWFHVKPGEALTLSAFLRADREGVAARLIAVEAPDQMRQKQVTVGTEWRRYQFTFRPTQAFLFIAVGLDLEASKMDSASLWLDAVQLERGEQATAYEPRQPLEAFLESAAPGNIFTNPPAGLALTLRAYNNSSRAEMVRGKLELTDFFDRQVRAGECRLVVPAHGGKELNLDRVSEGRQGFFRVHWTADSGNQSLRCAVITPASRDLTDSPLGFNHAYPWDFLVSSARQAGIVWWRDWSAKWQTIEPEKGRFDFSAADTQINRVRELGNRVEVLLPFPSAAWSTTARPEKVAKAAGRDDYLRTRLSLAFASKDLNDFGKYAAAVAEHYAGEAGDAATHIQILNEPVYTDYALPRQFGYTLADYLSILERASAALRGLPHPCRIVGGISAGLEAGLTHDFVAQGGLRWLDVFDLHMYDAARPAESYEDSFRTLEELMRTHGGPKPVWITEWGCYADDDPAVVPQTVGDPTMNRCRWPSERAATEHIVKFTAVAFAHGVRKIFFHAGTCGTINGPDAGGVLFEYGGAPRKMYPGVAVLSRLLGVPDQCAGRIQREGMRAYVFRTGSRSVGIAWHDEGTAGLKLRRGAKAYDIMGNELTGRDTVVGESPVYVVGDSPEEVLRVLGQ